MWIVIAAVPLIVILGGCAGSEPLPPMPFEKPGASQQEFMRDRFACIKQSEQQRGSAIVVDGTGGGSSGTVLVGSLYMSCMAALGYVPSQKGTLLPPGGAKVLFE